MNKLVIIDGNAIIHRAYHALPPMTTKSGLMVNAVYGFTSMLFKVINDLKPTHLAVTFDMAGGSHARLKKFAEYKGTRVKADQALYDQIPLVHEVVDGLGFKIYEKTGYEADDVIGTIVQEIKKAKKQENNASEVYVVTGDKDTLQLVGENVKVYTLRKGMSDTVIYDEAAVKERFGFGPELMVDYKALAGDPSDNIPGVPGVGEKTATDLIVRFGGIDEIYAEVKKLEIKKTKKQESKGEVRESVIKKLIAGEESARMSRELSTIDCNVPEVDFKLNDCLIKPFDLEKITEIFKKFEFISLLKRVPGVNGEGSEQKKPESKKTIKQKNKIDFNFVEIKKHGEVEALVKKIKDVKQFACRAIINGKDIFSAKFLGLVVVVEDDGFYLSVDVVGAKGLSPLHEIFADPEIELVGHDLKQLVKIITVGAQYFEPTQRTVGAVRVQNIEPLRKNIVGNRLFDTMIASYLLNPGSRAHDVPSVLLKVLGKTTPTGAGQESLFGVDARGTAEELWLILRAVEILKKDLVKIDNLGLLQKIEMPLIFVLAEMELNGIAVDNKKLAELSTRVNSEIKAVTKKIYNLAGEEFNISSPLQLREILFDKLAIPMQGIKKGKTGLSTAAEQLEKMRGLHPIIDEIEIYRELSKLQNTYIDVLPTLVNKTTGRIHTTFNQAVTATGRLSSSDPNLQNIPVRTEFGREIREAFVAEEGNVLVSADYSQIELRIVASLAQDKRMLEIFEKGEDIHKATAAVINGVPLDKVTKEMRRAAKEVNFGVLYGMGSYGLAWRADISRFDAKSFIEKYFREFSGVKKYIDQTLEFTKKEGYCETLFGRRRYIPELNASNFQLRAAGERMAINHPIQGTAADLMKMAMIAVSGEIKKARKQESKKANGDEIKLILQVHDELVLEVKKEQADEVGRLVKETMEKVAKLRVPIEVHVKIGKNWGKME